MLDDPQVCAEGWMELSTRLQQRCARLGAAQYRLNEWREPDDMKADADEAHRRLRRIHIAADDDHLTTRP